ncbi:MAG: hypothetical protein EZS28_013366 [Streblomastix strix]|uniref:Uncharacterized protein n=1 Tax=Streblomastix strix TaxID=222440 RepID=A0A5J4W888_9EUKA|nr:MAG: hypothetical protein EZS28_013366 [Streblomastix strix]
MSNDADLHSLDVLIIHDEILFGNVRHNTVGLIDQVTNINNQINNINNAPIPDVYTRPEANEIFDTKADKSDTYTKTETDTLLDAKANVVDIVDSYSKTEDDALLLLKADKTELIDSYTKSEDDALLLLKADKTDIIDAYTKTETDEKLDLKLNITDQIDTYTKTETDTKLDLKLNIADQIDSYTKTETDTKLDLKLNIADQIDAYTKTETDTKLDEKVDKTELDEYVDLTSTQTISGTKQFNTISVATVSKQNKNDASILLAGGGDMLVTSLVTQPQLQEVRDIASGKSKGYVFDSQSDLNDWMAIQDNVANLAIGDNLYIVDQQVTDYWWDGTNLRQLETEQPDMTNVITTLGTATGSGNAITDLSIDGNILTLAKNTTFVTTGSDQSITGMKTFTSTIISNGIQYSGYDNTSVFLAGGGVKSISDINASVDLSNYYNKTQTYSQTETNNLLNGKANTGVSYTKGEDDTLLLAKADKTQLIDSYTKTQTDNLLNDKANQSTTYTKTETDSLLEDKADVTALNDYVTLGTTQTITGQKQFNQNVTAASFVKSGADNTVVLLGAGGTKPIAEFGGSVDDSNYVKKTGQVTQSITGKLIRTDSSESFDNLQNMQYPTKYDVEGAFIKKRGKTLQVVEGYLRKGSEPEEVSEDDEDYVTRKDVQSKYVGIWGEQQIIGTKSFYDNVTANGFIKKNGTNQQVLLANGSTKPLSEFASGSVDDTNYVKKTGQVSQSITGNLIRTDSEESFDYLQARQYATKYSIDGAFVKKTGKTLQVIKGIIRKNMDDVERLSDDDDDYMTRGDIQQNFVGIWGNQSISGGKTFLNNVTATAFVKSGGTNQQVLLANGTVKPLSEFASGSVDDDDYVKKTGQGTQEIEGNLIRSGSEISFENLQPFQYITKQDAKYGFVQKEGQLVQSIEGKLRRKQDEEEEEESEDEDYLTKKELDGKYVTLGGTQTVTGQKTFTISVTAPAFVKYSGTNQQVLLADGTVKQLSEFSSGLQMEDITDKIRDWNMSISPLYKKLCRLGSLYLLFLQVKPLSQFNAGINPKICEFGTASEVISPTGTSSQPFYINFTPPTGTNYTLHIVNRNLLMNQDTIWGTDQAVVITTFWIL